MTESHRHANNIVLLLQPDRDHRDMYAEFLRYEGFTPLPLSMAHDGLRVASRAAVVVSEVLLPGPIDGVEFVTRLKNDERTKTHARDCPDGLRVGD
jgi:DNA-binding response OmpR family regulator